MDLLLFVSLNALNVFTVLMFISRVNSPSSAGLFGFLALLTAIPITVTGIFNKINSNHFLSWFSAFVFAAWAFMSLFLDYVLRIEFRNPPIVPVLVVFLVLFYFSIAGLGIYLFKVDKTFWLITAITTALNLAATFYAHFNGKG